MEKVTVGIHLFWVRLKNILSLLQYEIISPWNIICKEYIRPLILKVVTSYIMSQTYNLKSECTKTTSQYCTTLSVFLPGVYSMNENKY